MKEMLSEKNLKKFPEIPSKGNLDLDLVKKSVFFCI
jgi:DNA-directed RNA polymerase